MAYGLGVAKGMLTTIGHLIKPPVTIQYPEERLDMPIWTRGRPRLIYEVDSGELRCTACGACALACPVDVIKIEQHPSPVKGKVLDRFDIDMAGCIECALCVEACPFRAITMAPDFEMAAARQDRTQDLVFDMYELRIAGTPEIDAGMEHIQGVKRGARREAGAAAAPAAAARPAAGAAARPAGAAGAAPARPAAPAQPAAGSTPSGDTQAGGAPAPAAPAGAVGAPAGAAAAAAAPVPAADGAATAAPAHAAEGAPAAAAAAVPADYDPLTISDEALKQFPASERAKVYKARLKASGWQPPAPR